MLIETWEDNEVSTEEAKGDLRDPERMILMSMLKSLTRGTKKEFLIGTREREREKRELTTIMMCQNRHKYSHPCGS